MNDFWSRKLAGQQAPPPHVQPAPVQTGGAWWQTPAHPGVQSPTPPQGYGHPGSGDFPQTLTYQQLKGMRADQMNQEQMEQLALLELQEAKYNNACPQCGSTNFLPAGAKVGTARMSTDKCFECGAGARSPEPAVGATGGKAGIATKQLAGGKGNYGQHHTALPQGYLPTR